MLIVPAPQVHKRRSARKPAPSQTVRVLSVYILDNAGALWVFDSPMIIPADVPCPQLRIQTASGWQPAVTLGQVSPYLVACDYASGDLDPGGGQPWEIVDPPVGIDFGGANLVLPQNGLTVR